MSALMERIEALEEPRTKVRVEGLIDELWPARSSYLIWIENAEPRRHVAIRFGRGYRSRITYEGAGATWREAFAEVERAHMDGRIS